MTVLSGTVKFEQRINDGDFQHRVASAEITFNTEGTDVLLIAREARLVAVAQVRRALGLEPDSQIITLSGVAPRAVEAPVSATTSSMEQRHGLDANWIKTDEMPKSDEIGLVPPKARRGRKSASDPSPSGEVIEPSSTSSPGDGPLAPTDMMLQSACQARMERGMAEQDVEVSAKIRSLVATYVGAEGRKAAEIPQEKRQAFLAELLA